MGRGGACWLRGDISFFSFFQMASFIRHSAGGALNKTSHLKKTLFSTISPDGFRHHPGNPQSVFSKSGIESLSLTMQPIVIEDSSHAKASTIPNAAVSAEENATAEAITKPS